MDLLDFVGIGVAVFVANLVGETAIAFYAKVLVRRRQTRQLEQIRQVARSIQAMKTGDETPSVDKTPTEGRTE